MARPDEIFGECGDYYSIGIAIGGDYDHSGVPGATPDGGGVPPYHPVTHEVHYVMPNMDGHTRQDGTMPDHGPPSQTAKVANIHPWSTTTVDLTHFLWTTHRERGGI